MKTKVTNDKEKLAYSVEEISEQTTLSIPFLPTEIRSGHLKVKRFGSRVLILNQDLNAYLQKQKVEASDEFFSCFFDDDETIHLRFLKPKDEKKDTSLKKVKGKEKKILPQNGEVTRRELREDSDSINQILKLNKEYGVYFTVNAGGEQRKQI